MMSQPNHDVAEVKSSSPILTSLFEREGSMWGSLKRPSLRRESHKSMIEEARSDDNDLCHDMLTTFGFTQEQMHRAAERFHLGRSKSGKTIYWQIDELSICRDGRIGDAWVSTMLQARYPDLAQYVRPQHCLFGLHQISQGPHLRQGKAGNSRDPTPIGIVESERSAVLLSELHPALLWLATSPIAHCTLDLFEPLRGHRVTVFPHTDDTLSNYVAWLELSDMVRQTYHLDLTISDTLEKAATTDQKCRSIDLVDFLFEST